DAQPFHICRSAADFPLILASWKAKTWLALDSSGQPAAYLVVNQSGRSVHELLAADPGHLLPAAVAWVRQQPEESIRFTLKPWSLPAIRQFGQICEHWQAGLAIDVQILDWPLVLGCMLRLKDSLEDLPDGSLRLKILMPDETVALCLTLDHHAAVCLANTDAGPDCGDTVLTLDAASATRLLFGPLPPAMTLPGYDRIPAGIRRILNNWFPLPFSWPEADDI
ncbi:MAG TPA: hypothetical protein DD640_00775, partial [Clostridiales bacterium]|nr:hypothetical protein [Clostridiales bacterium]